MYSRRVEKNHRLSPRLIGHVAVDLAHCRSYEHGVDAIDRVSVAVVVSTASWQLHVGLNTIYNRHYKNLYYYAASQYYVRRCGLLLQTESVVCHDRDLCKND